MTKKYHKIISNLAECRPGILVAKGGGIAAQQKPHAILHTCLSTQFSTSHDWQQNFLTHITNVSWRYK